MSISQRLPEAEPSSLKHSKELSDLISKTIHQNNGRISFEQYMQMVLYHPGYGYYSAGLHKIGEKGDFITAPEISPLFGQIIAMQSISVLEEVRHQSIESRADILEFGAGTGKLACDLLLQLEKLNHLPAHYYIIELSADLQQRQQQLFNKKIPHLEHRIQWLSSLPENFNGVIIANEVIDAMPVKSVKIENKMHFERQVSRKDNQFFWADEINETPELEKDFKFLDRMMKENNISTYITEVNINARHWIKELSGILQCGAILLIDYGYPQTEYYHPQRKMGTLMCHYRHHAHSDPFVYPGLQDITTHVNFSDIAQTAMDNHLEISGYTTQAHFLMHGGLAELCEQIDTDNSDFLLKTAQQIKMLTLPNHMGELFKVMLLSKSINTSLSAFKVDMREKL